MNKNIKALSLILLMSSAAQSVYAAKELKLAVVDAEEIMMGTDIAQAAAKKLEKEQQLAMADLEKEGKLLEDRKKTFEAKRTTMSDESQRKEMVALSNAAQDFETSKKKKSQDIKLSYENELQAVGTEFTKVVTKEAKKQDLSLVIEKKSGQIIYASDDLSITDSIKVAMNNEFKATQLAEAKGGVAKKATA